MATIDRYFDKFPIIQYGNNSVVDITARTTLLDKVSNNPYVFYPYEITSNERPDQLSYRYYEDPFKSWIIYLTNNIVDPYYEWYLSNDEFQEFIEKKYGSAELAQQKISYYKNDYENASDIDLSTYDALTPSMKKYWEPIFDSYNKISSYSRKKINWVSNTNRIVAYDVNSLENFIKDEIADIIINDNIVARGQIVTNNLTSSTLNTYEIILQHLVGDYFVEHWDQVQTALLVGRESNASTTIVNNRILSENISPEEENYWKAVTFYEHEFDKNEFNKTIRVLDSRFSRTIVNNLKDLMNK